MLSEDTDTSSDEDFILSETEQSKYDNSQPILLRNPFYHKQSSSEFIESRSSTFNDDMDNDSDDSVISYVEESIPESSVHEKIEVDTSQNEEGNEIILQNFPGRITIKYSPITRKRPDNKTEDNRVERGVQTDRSYEILRDCENMKQERESQNNELIKGEEDETSDYNNAREENHDHDKVLEETDYKRDTKFDISDTHLRDRHVELEEGENRDDLVHPNAFMIQVTRVEMDVEVPQADLIDHNIKVENSNNQDDENRSDSSGSKYEEQKEIKTDSSSVIPVGVSSSRMHLDISHTDAINENLKNEIHQNVEDDNLNDEKLQNVQLENVRGENIFQHFQCYDILANMRSSRPTNSNINITFGETEVLPKEAPCYRSNVENINEDLIINIPRVDVPQVKMEVEESQVEFPNDENNKNLCNEEQLMDKGQIPVDEPKIYVKSRTQLFPEDYRSLNSTVEENSQVFSAIHSEKSVEAQSSDNLNGEECLMSQPGEIYSRTNRESELSPESQDLVRRRGLRTRVLPESSKKPVSERVNNIVDECDADSVETVRILEPLSPPHSSEAETVILPGKQGRSTQTTQFRDKNVTEESDSVSSGTSTVTGSSEQKEEEERLIFSQATEFYRRKPFSPKEDKVIIDYFLECRREFEIMPEGLWKMIASLPELTGRTEKSVYNRFTRYLKGRCRHYITDPEMLKWFLSTTREGERVPRELLDDEHNNSEYDEL